MDARCCLHDDLRIRLLGDKVLADREFQLCCTEKCGGTRGRVGVVSAAWGARKPRTSKQNQQRDQIGCAHLVAGADR
jgi:hypothetical protein